MKEKCPECKGTDIKPIKTEIEGKIIEELSCEGCGLIFGGMPIVTTTKVLVKCPCCKEDVEFICREITVGDLRKRH